MGVVYLAYCGSWQLSLHVPCFCAFYIFNTTPNPTSSSFFQNVFVLVLVALRLDFHNMVVKCCTTVAQSVVSGSFGTTKWKPSLGECITDGK